MSALTGRGRQSGAALVLVLWLIVLLAGVVAAYAFTARVEQLQSHTGQDLLRGGEIARAGLEYGLHRLRSTPAGQRAWSADGQPHDWQFAGVPVQVRLQAESGKVDLNHADADLLTALFQQAGVDPGQATRLAAAVIDWRDGDDLVQPAGGAEQAQYLAAGLPHGPGNAPFVSLGELRRVLGMTEGVFQALQPLVTIWSDRTQPDPAVAPEPVLRAMGLDPAPWLAARQGVGEGIAPGQRQPLVSRAGSFTIDSRARLGDGREVWLRAVVRTGTVEAEGPAYEVLHWQQGMGTR